MKCAVFLVLGFATLAAQTQTPPSKTPPVAGNAVAKGTCTVASIGHNNTLKIECGIGQERGQEMVAILNKILANRIDSKQVMAKLDEILAHRQPALTVNAPNGIGTIGGTLVNPQVNNFGPPPPIVKWRVESTTPDQVSVSITVDRAPEIPAFIVQCDSPCRSASAFAGVEEGGTYYNDDSINYTTGIPNTAVVLMTPHRPVGPGTGVFWMIASSSGKPLKILSVDLLPTAVAATLPQPAQQ